MRKANRSSTNPGPSRATRATAFRCDLVPFHDVVRGYDVPSLGIDLLEVDAIAGPFVELVETQINATVRPPRVYRSADEIKAEMTARGIPYQRFFPPQFDHDDEPANDGPVIDLEAEK
jgi:hypothetical protein